MASQYSGFANTTRQNGNPISKFWTPKFPYRRWRWVPHVHTILSKEIDDNKITMMTTTKRRQRKSYSLDETLANIVENATAVIVQRFLRQCRQKSRTGMRNQGGLAPGRIFRRRYRRSVQDIYEEVGALYFRRAYQMKCSTFMSLVAGLRRYIIAASILSQWTDFTRCPTYMCHSLVCGRVRTSYTYDHIRYWPHSDTIKSCWYVVDAINRQQWSIVKGFYDVSSAGFGCCAGAVDGILNWIHEPSQKDCTEAGCNPGKLFCGIKKTCGLSCQAVCDTGGWILDISIVYPGSTSDCLTLEGL